MDVTLRPILWARLQLAAACGAMAMIGAVLFGLF